MQLLRRSRLAPFQVPPIEGALRTARATKLCMPCCHSSSSARPAEGKSFTVAFALFPVRNCAPRSTTVTVRLPNSTPSANALMVCTPVPSTAQLSSRPKPVLRLPHVSSVSRRSVPEAAGVRIAPSNSISMRAASQCQPDTMLMPLTVAALGVGFSRLPMASAAAGASRAQAAADLKIVDMGVRPLPAAKVQPAGAIVVCPG